MLVENFWDWLYPEHWSQEIYGFFSESSINQIVSYDDVNYRFYPLCFYLNNGHYGDDYDICLGYSLQQLTL